MRAVVVASLALGCGGEQLNMYPWLEGPGPQPPVVVALATSGPGVTLTPAGEVDGQLWIAGEEAWKLLAVDVQREPETLPIPPALRRRGTYLWAVFRICATDKGRISTVSQLKSADRLVDENWRRAVRLWRFRPVQRDAVARPFCSDLPVGARVQ